VGKVASNEITPERHVEFLSEQYARAEKIYHDLCDECAELSEQLIKKRKQADDQLAYLHRVGQEILDAMQEVR